MHNKIDLAPYIVEAIHDIKGKKVTILDLSNLEMASAGKFIICEGTSTMHVSSVADRIREQVQEKTGRKPYNYDGYRSSQWIVIDYGEILVHVFLPETRNLYDLEQLWSDSVITNVEDPV